MPLPLIAADWPAPANVRALTTTRAGGVSRPPYDALNLGDHVGDVAANVATNRARLCADAGLPAEPMWLQQVHGVEVVDAAAAAAGARADGSFARRPGVVCAVLTADCLPILLCDRAGTVVAALHAGWRGLAAGIVEAGVARLGVAGAALLAYLGPAIGAGAYEVGDDVRDAFVDHDADATAAFRRRDDRWLADMTLLARLRLQQQGITAIYGGTYCTASAPDLFYSYRRDGVTGRMASLIWLR